MQLRAGFFTFFSDNLDIHMGVPAAKFGRLWQMLFSFSSHERYNVPGASPVGKEREGPIAPPRSRLRISY